MKRLLYLLYHIKNLDAQRLKLFLDYVHRNTGRSKLAIIGDNIAAVLKYKISILEYFQFQFYQLSGTERARWAGTGYMYEYQLLMNPKEYREELEDKAVFLQKYSSFIAHRYTTLADLEAGKTGVLEDLLRNNKSGKLVLKSSSGQCGWGVEVVNASEYNVEAIMTRLTKSGNDIVEEYVVQHKDLMNLSPSGLNTIRIFTQLNNHDEVEFLGCRLRISVNSIVDNMAAGNIAAAVDEHTGIVIGPGVYSDITKPDELKHPVTGVPIVGFQIPFWQETVKMIKQAAKATPNNRSVGWDIAITDNGPELIEGNHDWCKLVWQLPVRKGLKNILETYKNQLLNSQ